MPGLSADGLRAGMSAAACSGGDAGRYVAAMSHAQLAWQGLPPASCPAAQTNDDNGCAVAGWGSEPVCCGSGCVLAGCPNDIYFGRTTIYDNQAAGCGNVGAESDVDGFLCCKV